jgi:hypothetical protein
MGMFDTFRASVAGREREVQSKDFACVLGTYRIGDQVHYDKDRPASWREGPYFIVEEANELEGEAAPPWVALLICEDTYCDYEAAASEQEAMAAGQSLLLLWQAPESRIRRMMWRQQQIAEEREVLLVRIERIYHLLSDYYHWCYQQEFPPKPSKHGRLMKKFFGPSRDYGHKPFDRWLSAELNEQQQKQPDTSNRINVDYYFTLLEQGSTPLTRTPPRRGILCRRGV